MGNFLDVPITEKETEVGEEGSVGLSYGLSAMQGWRSQMEDDHVQIMGLPGLPELSLFGVYDGHGGDTVAHYVARHFPRCLLETKQLTADMKEEEVTRRAQLAFEQALMAIDREMLSLAEMETGHDQSGTTSVMTLISRSHIICANTGDSRAVLSRSGTAIALSHDHKPANPIEKERIEAAGSHVKFNRVNGDLAVSRALGDFVYKRCESVSAELQAVTAFPEMIAESRHVGQDEFIVLACDGIWDVMSSQDVVDKVRHMLQHGRPPPSPVDDAAAYEEVASGPSSDPLRAPPPPRPWDLGAMCECLIDHCLRLGSRDNMSVIIVMLSEDMKPKSDNDHPTTLNSGTATASPGPAAASPSSGVAGSPSAPLRSLGDV